MKSDSFYREGLCFQCQQCSHCCCDEPGYVYLSRRDLDALLGVTGMRQQKFIDTYCRFVPYYDGTEVLCLQEKDNYDCIFWENGCSVYAGRPVQCSTYPFWTYILDSRNAWNEESKECPGINKGSKISGTEIENQRIMYHNNIPLRRGEV
ncbi:MAG: YkgJ family cysteine cluster protein [Treponemataceae bacterium]|nr:YkgJ family cysteine cluster protein [Treponemataceae bacterium]